MRASGVDDDDILFIMREPRWRQRSAHDEKRAMFTKNKKSSVEIKSEKRCHVCRVLNVLIHLVSCTKINLN